MLRDNTWGFPAFFVTTPLPQSFDRATLWEGSDGHKAFLKLCNFISGVMKYKVLDNTFPFKLEQLDEVTLKRVGCSCA